MRAIQIVMRFRVVAGRKLYREFSGHRRGIKNVVVFASGDAGEILNVVIPWSSLFPYLIPLVFLK